METTSKSTLDYILKLLKDNPSLVAFAAVPVAQLCKLIHWTICKAAEAAGKLWQSLEHIIEILRVNNPVQKAWDRVKNNYETYKEVHLKDYFKTLGQDLRAVVTAFDLKDNEDIIELRFHQILSRSNNVLEKTNQLYEDLLSFQYTLKKNKDEAKAAGIGGGLLTGGGIIGGVTGAVGGVMSGGLVLVGAMIVSGWWTVGNKMDKIEEERDKVEKRLLEEKKFIQTVLNLRYIEERYVNGTAGEKDKQMVEDVLAKLQTLMEVGPS